MTIANTTFQQPLTGDAVTLPFTFSWPIVEDDQVAVYVAGVLKTLGSDYTLTTNRLTTGLGGTVTFLVAPAASAAIIIQRNTDKLQERALENNESMPPATVMAMVDKLTCLAQDALRKFISSDTTIAAATTYAIAHGLGKIPDRINLCLVCTITDGGYAVGDVIDLAGLTVNASAGSILYSVSRDITNVVVRFGPASVAAALNAIAKTGNTATTISPFANWKLRVYAS